jgi:hypothetical protein
MDQVGQALLAFYRTFDDLEVPETPCLVEGGLDSRATYSSARCDAIDRQITYAVVFDLTGNDTEHCALALGVVMPQGVG